jgi:hypothetical protein
LRLLLDEMYPPSIAEQLRARAHDVTAVTERAELRSLPDAAIFDVAQQECRVIMTENIADFAVLADRADHRGGQHQGLVLIDPSKYPRGDSRTIGRLVTALHAVLRTHSSDEPTSVRHWL